MKKKYVKQIENGILEKEELMNEREIEVASKILNELDGILAIRATSILKFCIKAVQYNKVKFR
ncbi:hypothetical protein JJB67_11395 [Clostridium perfringens]|uniref:hypothetical protein n=1 Tax=Clostridium perfringens TaxID=1502 RepID=UPI000D717B1F|nr:hypothetical protein [Clostridium perfringens]MBO3322932.1 hypothetical protein [Clostridium perfringens]MBO3332096.1 hypothetical protein [Clostridium perfringens]PWW97941.1 hypothetical protein CYK75_14670 [Clostridium perfringens]HAT4273794.1 hypothetical protein [Clostridium perfringens]